jgi:hypothetical protein
MHPSGLREVMIWRPSDLENVDPAKQVARIAHTVGENKRVLILEEAKKRSIRILNHGLKKTPEPEITTDLTPETSTAETESGTVAKKLQSRKTTK